MASVEDHYAGHLGPVYAWMAGGIEVALQAGAQDLRDFVAGSGLAVDLGAGFGMHSIPLARAGYEVIAVDTCTLLLEELRRHSAGLPIQIRSTDLLDFSQWVPEPAALILCMGDTLTHLACTEDVERLCGDVARALAPGGRFVATFRDYTTPAAGERRFIPVRSDADRILTCFLEDTGSHITVHDLVHERHGAQWTMKVSSYPKLRLPPSRVAAALEGEGLRVQQTPGPRGMVRISAQA